MKKKLFIITVLALLVLLSASTVFAGKLDNDIGYPWRAHEAPFDFLFGNMIDSHQQSNILKNEGLKGFIYIHYTGEYTDDGIPIARKANCEEEECSVGWVIKGVPVTATLKNNGPRIWMVNPDDLPKEPGYTHFQWKSNPKKPHGLELNTLYDGYLLKRVAVARFYWVGGSGNKGGSSGGGCGGHETGTHETSVEESGGCSDGGCSDDHDSGGGSSGHGGRLVVPGLDAHSNIITSLDEPWHGGGCDD